MSRSTVALVPLRAPGAGKTRLSGVLSATERAALAGAMLADVCHALEQAPIDDLVVVAGGETAAGAASALGVEVLLDPPGVRSLDAAIRAAQHRLGAVDALLVVTADLPRLTADDVRTVLDQDAEVVVAPTDDGGTGGLLRRPGDAIATAYGPNSARRHQAEAQRRGRRLATVRTVGFATDVDTLADLTGLASGPVGPTTAALLAGWSAHDADAG